MAYRRLPEVIARRPATVLVLHTCGRSPWRWQGEFDLLQGLSVIRRP
jgi:hypothetical protein